MDMQSIKQSVMRFIKDEEGLTIVEYAIAGGLIAVGVVAAFITLGGAVQDNIEDLTSAVQSRPS
ncbi:Flp family type IVb pilin [Pseudomonas sp. NW5]|uniref:Flp family type IVb pilin n=1 Tax=Pseudomonas sp. NW5 TaxID=2934934 RepID=UPI002021D3EE|nr:Flp family type IVb pilin [Pseudomonas sp. NW5]MCL7461211.1 Flp family type IVb pilin [Pseudomonas sp. NW5]